MKKLLKKQSGKIKINSGAIGLVCVVGGLIAGLVYWQEMTKQKLEHLTSKFQIEKLHEAIVITEENKNASFFEGHTEKYSLFSAPAYYKKCLLDTNAQNIEDLDDISDFEYIPTYKNKELTQMYLKDPTSILAIKIKTNDFAQVVCEGFSWNAKNQELFYQEKPVRFIIKNPTPAKE